MTRVLVVARHEEDPGWLRDCPDGWTVRVVQKGRDMANVGREASSYLWWMARAEIDPNGSYGFVQGRPWDHGFTWDALRDVDAFTPLGGPAEDDADGHPNHAGLQLGRAHRAWFGSPGPERFAFHRGAQFLVPGRVLLSRPREDYERIRALVEDDAQGPWLMERFWALLWGQPRS